MPHNEFIGKIGARIDRGPDSEINIKKFITDSITSPWELNNILSVSSAPVSTFFSQFKTLVESRFHRTFYSYVSELSFEKFSDWSRDNNLLNKDQSIGRLAKILSKQITLQIYRAYLSPASVRSQLHTLSTKELRRYTRLAIDCIYDILFATDSAAAIEERKKLYSFLSSEGREEVIIDFSSGRQGFTFGDRGSLHHMTEFYKLKLTWGDYMSIFWLKDGPSIANALAFSISSKTYDTFLASQTKPRFAPHTMLGNRQDYIIKIVDFLKFIATEFGDGEKIRIYGYKEGISGFGNTAPFGYFPTHTTPILDWSMPSNNEFYYEIDPNDLDAFSLEHFRVFLGALFADHQGFFVRTSDMGQGEFLFAFNLFGDLEKIDILLHPDGKYTKPTGKKHPINFIDPVAFSKLSELWLLIISDMKNDNLLATMHRYSDIGDWHSYLILLPMLDETQSTFNSIGT